MPGIIRNARRTKRHGRQYALFGAALLAACSHDWNATDAGTSEVEEAGMHAGNAEGDPTTGDATSDASSVSDPDATLDVAGDASPETGLTGSSIGDSGQSSNPDAGVAGGADATPGLDGDVPASDAQGPEAATASPCAYGDAGFCADFEDGKLDTFSWQELTTTSQAALSVIETPPASGGKRALRSVLTGAADETARAALWLLDGTPTWFRASFDFLPQLSLPVQGGSLVFWFQLTEQAGTTYPAVALASNHDGTFLVIRNFDGVNETYDAYPTTELPSGWVHVELEVLWGVSGSASLRFNGSQAVAYAGAVQALNVMQSYVQLGLYAQQTPASSALYDNLTVDFKP